MVCLTPPALAAWSLLGTSADAQLSIVQPEESAAPPVARAPAPSAPQAGVDYQIYPLRQAQANDVEEPLVRMLEDFGARAEVVADQRHNRILVRGNPQTVKMAGQLLETLDRPTAPRLPPRPYLKSYRVPGEDLADATRWAQDEFAGVANVRIASDTRTSQMLVLAPPEVHDQLAEKLKAENGYDAATAAPPAAARPAGAGNLPAGAGNLPAGGAPTGVPGTPAARTVSYPGAYPGEGIPQSQPANPPAAPNYNPASTVIGGYSPPAVQPKLTGRVIPLRDANWQSFEQSLIQLGAQKIASGDQTPVVEYHVNSAAGRAVLYVDRRSNQVIVRGTDGLAESAQRLVMALDASTQPARGVRVMPVKRVTTVQQALDTVLTSGVATDNEPEKDAPKGADARKGNNPLLARVFQQPGAQPPAAQPPAAQPPAAAQPEPVIPGEGEVGEAAPGRSVRIEYIEGLDIFVLSGPKAAVERVRQLIEEIERINASTEPLIQIYPLKHVDSQALATMVVQLYDQVLSARQGQVSVTPLIKPNSLLLIGRPDSVETVVKLIERLDQPVGPATQFETFRLRHASAAAAKATIDEFLGSSPGQPPVTGAGGAGRVRPGLGTKAVVTADFRSNSLIVQASPRDLAEISLLIQKIDVADSDAVAELRVFKLENSLADELAPILQDAINGQGGARRTTGGQQQIQLPGLQQQPGGQQQGATGQQAKSTVLRFLTLDAAGQRKLQSGILTDVKITSDPRANALLVSAPAQSMDLIEALVRQLDRIPAAVAQIKVFTIVNGDAANMVDMLEALFGQAQQAARLGIGQFGPQQPGGGGVTAVQGENMLVPLRFSVDQRTNSIVASGAANDLSIVEAILLRLDESDVRQRKNHVYRLKNSPAVDVSNAVNEFLRSQRNVQQIAPQALSPFEQIEREVIVVPEPVSNSLIVSATPRYFDEIAAIVERLDARPPMVTIQVLIAQVALNNTDEFGVELGIQDSVLFDRSVIGDIVTVTQTVTAPAGNQITNQQIVSQTATPGFNFIGQPLGNNPAINSSRFGPQGFTNFAVGRVNSELGYGGLVLSGGNDKLSFLVRALKECRRLEVLSRPQVTTLDNQPAFIQVGQRVPRITGSTTNQTGQTNQVTLENVGLILGVTPRISPDGLVVMEIDAERSEVGPEAQGIPVSISATGAVVRSPRIDTTTAQTTVSALSGQTVVLGGLITKSKSEVHRRVPYLSDVAVLGNLFRYDSVVTQRTELLIIMTPHVIRTEFDNERIKQVEAARMSWCLSDVQKLHGDIHLQSREGEFSDAETTVIYPDADPTGKVDASKQGPNNPSLINPSQINPGDAAPTPGTGPALNPGRGPGPNVPPPARLPEIPDFQRTPKVNDGAKNGAKAKAKSSGGVKGIAKSIRSRFEPTPAEEPREPTPAGPPPIQSTAVSSSMIQPTMAIQPMPMPVNSGQNGGQNPGQNAGQFNQGQFNQGQVNSGQFNQQQAQRGSSLPPSQLQPLPPTQQQQPQQPLREPVPHVWPENPAFDPEEEYPPRGQAVRPAVNNSVPRSPPSGQRAYYEWQDGPTR